MQDTKKMIPVPAMTAPEPEPAQDDQYQPAPEAGVTLRGALRLFRADLARRSQLREEPMTVWHVIRALAQPGVMAVLLLRVGNWLHATNHRILARLIERLIFLISRSEMHPGSRIGPGLVLADEGLVGLTGHARIGSNCTLFAMTALVPQADGAVDIVLGDNCVVGRRVRIFGAITLGDGTQIKENSVVLTSFTSPGMVVSGIPARCDGQLPLDRVKSWNPLRGQPLGTGGGSAAP